MNEKHLKIFAEVIDKAFAKKLLDFLYEKDLDASKFDQLLRNIHNYFMKNKYWKQVKWLTDEELEEIYMTHMSINEGCVKEYSEKTMWSFSEIAEFKDMEEGQKVDIQIARAWKWNHPMYWKIEMSEQDLKEMKKNYDTNQRGIDLAIDENHEPNHKALGWIKDVYLKGKGELFATIELTKMGAELLSKGAYKYFSPEIIFNKKDEETWKTIKNLLVGGAFTNRPFFKAMQALMANEENSNQIPNNILYFNTSRPMKTILELLAKFAEAQKLSKEERELLTAQFSELSEEDKTDDLKAAVSEATQFNEEVVPEVVPEVTPEVKEEEKKEEFKEGEEVTIKASELSYLRNIASQAAGLIQDKRKSDITNKVNGMKFSESNKVGIVLPKVVNEVVEFAFSLDEDKSTKFFSILEKLQTVAADEIWHSKDITEKYNEDAVKFFMENLWMDKESAIIAAEDAAK